MGTKKKSKSQARRERRSRYTKKGSRGAQQPREGVGTIARGPARAPKPAGDPAPFYAAALPDYERLREP